MENYLFKNYKSISEDISKEKGIELNNKLNKKKKVRAHEIPIKEFFSDDDNDENEEIYKSKRKKFVLISKFTNKRKINLSKNAKYSKNSILLYKDQLQKKSTIDQIPNKRRERQNILIEDISDRDTAKDKLGKKVTFSKNNFVEYINIESFKKYNSFFADKLPYSDEKIKSDSKCCLIY